MNACYIVHVRDKTYDQHYTFAHAMSIVLREMQTQLTYVQRDNAQMLSTFDHDDDNNVIVCDVKIIVAFEIFATINFNC
jgi:hypothetical protein